MTVDKRVRAVTLVLTNGSTRFKPCWRGTSYSCQGSPQDDDAAFAFTAVALAVNAVPMLCPRQRLA